MPDPDFHHPPSYPSARRGTRPGRCSWRGQSVGASVAEAPRHPSRRSQPRFPVQLPFWAPLTNWTLFSKLAGETFLPCWNHFQSYIGKPEAAGQPDSWPVNEVHWGEIGFTWRAVYAEGVEVDGEESMNIRNSISSSSPLENILENMWPAVNLVQTWDLWVSSGEAGWGALGKEGAPQPGRLRRVRGWGGSWKPTCSRRWGVSLAKKTIH